MSAFMVYVQFRGEQGYTNTSLNPPGIVSSDIEASSARGGPDYALNPLSQVPFLRIQVEDLEGPGALGSAAEYQLH